MHLINTKTLQLKSFVSENDVRYAILSHRWESEEILYEDIQDLSSCRKSGISKIKTFCGLAQGLGYEYAWIDTCCIDKKSSAELAEAINSMYRYYKNAGECIVYLSDVHYDDVEDPSFEDSFRNSVWFTRCWALQELLAPTDITFYNSMWESIDTKWNLKELISDITKIDQSALEGLPLANFSIAQRMSWASHRRATRTEDIAYSLMGIFDVNMSMLYGEGDRAFTRLQEEILRYSDDESIFAWANANGETYYSRGLLAASPLDFKDCRWMRSTQLHERTDSFVLTNRGIAGTLMTACEKRVGQSDIYIAFLNVSLKEPESPEQFVGIFLQQQISSTYDMKRQTVAGTNTFRRVTSHNHEGNTHRWYGSHLQISFMSCISSSVRVRHRGQGSQNEPESAHGFDLAEILSQHTEVDGNMANNEIKQAGPSSMPLDRRAIRLFDAQWAEPGNERSPIVRLPPWSEYPLCAIVLDEYSTNPVFVMLALSRDHLPACIIIDNKTTDGGRHPFDSEAMFRKAEAFWWKNRDTSWPQKHHGLGDVVYNLVRDELWPNLYAIKVRYQTEMVRFLCVQSDPMLSNDRCPAWSITLTPFEKPHMKLWQFKIERTSLPWQSSNEDTLSVSSEGSIEYHC